MRQIREVLRLHFEQGLSQRVIACALNMALHQWIACCSALPLQA